MKILKRFMSVLISAILIFALCFTAKARHEVQYPKNGMFCRISYAANNRYIDIPAEKYSDNGAQLQLWDYVYGNQNQIFRLINSGDGWRIVSANGRIVEVGGSKHDDYAPVVQWDAHNLNCGLWYVRRNSDGTVSFQNKESGKYLNVMGGGDAGNGTKMIQYHDDGTIAMRFRIEELGYSDVYSATFQRDIQDSEIQWIKETAPAKHYPIYNLTGFTYIENDIRYRPVDNQRLFVSMEFLSPNNVANLIKEKSYDKLTWEKIRQAVSGELKNEMVTELAEWLGFNIPFVGTALSILQIIWDSQESNQWNRFLDAVKIDNQGRVSGVIVYNYKKIVSCIEDHTILSREEEEYIWRTYGPHDSGNPYSPDGLIAERSINEKEFKTWTGDNFGDVYHFPEDIKSGRWNLRFK
jgi:hypothetical protein